LTIFKISKEMYLHVKLNRQISAEPNVIVKLDII